MSSGQSRSPLKDARLLRKLGKMLGMPGAGLPSIINKVRELQTRGPAGELSSARGARASSGGVDLEAVGLLVGAIRATMEASPADCEGVPNADSLSREMLALRGQPSPTLPLDTNAS